MFAMYDDDGLNFRDTLDKIHLLQDVSAPQKIKNDLQNNNKHNFKDELYNKGKITKEAIEHYKQIANLDIKHEVFHVKDIMTKDVISIPPDTTVLEAYELMQKHNIQQLPIKSNKLLHLQSMISKHTILQLLMDDLDFTRLNLKKRVDEITTQKLITTDPITDIRRVSKMMIDLNINAIPVVDMEDIVVGIATRNNILKAVSNIPHLQIWA